MSHNLSIHHLCRTVPLQHLSSNLFPTAWTLTGMLVKGRPQPLGGVWEDKGFGGRRQGVHSPTNPPAATTKCVCKKSSLNIDGKLTVGYVRHRPQETSSIVFKSIRHDFCPLLDFVYQPSIIVSGIIQYCFRFPSSIVFETIRLSIRIVSPFNPYCFDFP